MKDAWIAPAIIWGLLIVGAGFVWLRIKWRVSRLRVGAYYTIEPNDPFGPSATVVLLEMRGGWCSYKFWSKKYGLMDGPSSAKASTFAMIYTRIPTPLEHKP